MLDKYLKIETLSVVFIGDFNPVIIQPFWLSQKTLIRDDEAENAKVEVIHNESDIVSDPRLLQLEILENSRFDNEDFSRRIKITPSDQKISNGITININNHFYLKTNVGNTNLFSLIGNYWSRSKNDSNQLVENLLKKIDF